ERPALDGRAPDPLHDLHTTLVRLRSRAGYTAAAGGVWSERALDMEVRMRTGTWMAGLMVIAWTGVASAQGGAAAPPAAPPADPPATEHKVVAPDAIKWGELPPIFQKGGKMTVLLGDPSKEGMFIVRIKLPANYKVMPHFHPTTENVTVLSGALAIG